MKKKILHVRERDREREKGEREGERKANMLIKIERNRCVVERNEAMISDAYCLLQRNERKKCGKRNQEKMEKETNYW